MKIKHLLEYVFPKIQHVEVKTDRHPGRAPRKSDDVKNVGSGSFATAWHNPQRTPHDVRKVSDGNDRSDIDGFYFYLLELEKHADNTNPYFPRFRGIKIYTDTSDVPHFGKEPDKDYITYSAQMEKLTSLVDLSKSEEQSILFRLFGDRQHRRGPTSRFIEKLLTRTYQPYGQKLLGVIEEALKSNLGLIKIIVDDDFKRAIRFFKKVQKKQGLAYDMHDDNIMVRRTPYGPQLVFLDPFSYQFPHLKRK